MKIVEAVLKKSNFDRSLTMPMKVDDDETRNSESKHWQNDENVLV